jgi:uncharacterized protein (TIGR02284 family)
METTSVTVENLNDLIQIHNDRIAGYEKALKDLDQDDQELKTLFSNLIGESHQFKMELGTEVQALGGDIETDTSFSGKIHRAWMSVKDAFGNANKSVLENCEFGEDATLKAYASALDDESLPTYVREIVMREQGVLQAAHDKVKALRDSRKEQ